MIEIKTEFHYWIPVWTSQSQWKNSSMARNLIRHNSNTWECAHIKNLYSYALLVLCDRLCICSQRVENCRQLGICGTLMMTHRQGESRLLLSITIPIWNLHNPFVILLLLRLLKLTRKKMCESINYKRIFYFLMQVRKSTRFPFIYSITAVVCYPSGWLRVFAIWIK